MNSWGTGRKRLSSVSIPTGYLAHVGASADLFFLLHLTEGYSIPGAINFFTPTVTNKPPASSQYHTPLFVGRVLITALLAVLSVKVPAAMVINTAPSKYHLLWSCKEAAIHLFWCFDHMKVCTFFLPGFGVIPYIIMYYLGKKPNLPSNKELTLLTLVSSQPHHH